MFYDVTLGQLGKKSLKTGWTGPRLARLAEVGLVPERAILGAKAKKL